MNVKTAVVCNMSEEQWQKVYDLIASDWQPYFQFTKHKVSGKYHSLVYDLVAQECKIIELAKSIGEQQEMKRKCEFTIFMRTINNVPMNRIAIEKWL